MNQRPTKSVVERIIDWLRGLVTAPDARSRKSTGRKTQPTGSTGAKEPSGSDRAAGDVTEPLHDTTTTQGTAAAAGTSRELPDLDDDDLGSGRSDLNDTAGDYAEDDDSYPSEASGADDAFNLHDAVGGHDDEADDDTDGVIDTSRDADFASRSAGVESADNVPEVDNDIPDVSDQDELTAFEGASSDEFAAGGYTPKPLDQDAVEAAAAGDPAMVADEDSPGNVAHQHDVAAGRNGDDDVARRASDQRPTSGSGGVTREEIESTAEGDAVLQGDEAVGAPGRSDPGAFTDAETGTTKPSRSATGNGIDDEQDALSTTLDYDEDEASAFDADDANLSSQEELAVDDQNAGDTGDERVTSFQSGTTARENLDTGAAASTQTDQNTDSYADFPDEPVPEDTDDSGLDDFAGDDYPSDHRIDRVDGDDAFDAIRPDDDEAGSSAGDLDAPDQGEEQLIVQVENAQNPGGDIGTPARTIDQDDIATSDEHVGGEKPGFVENMQDVDAPAGGGSGDAAGRGEAGTKEAGDMPAGAVRGDGTTDTPAGYPIKGNASSMIYHLPDFPSYKSTKAEFCFATEEAAIAAGYRAPGRRNRGRSN